MFIVTILVHFAAAFSVMALMLRLRAISVNPEMKQRAAMLWYWFACLVFVIFADLVAQYYFNQWVVWIFADVIAISALGFAFRDTQAIAKKFTISSVPANGWLLQLWLLWAACIVVTIAQLVWL